MNIENVFIVGSGLMGSGIAQVCAQSGLRVILNDVRPEALAKSLKDISWSVMKFVEKGYYCPSPRKGKISLLYCCGPSSSSSFIDRRQKSGFS